MTIRSRNGIRASSWLGSVVSRRACRAARWLALPAVLAMAALGVTDSVDGREKSAELFHPPGLQPCDLWFAKQGHVYHAFYVQWPQLPGKWGQLKRLSPLLGTGGNLPGKPLGYGQIGHATSRDLGHWTACGPVLMPQRETWNDVRVATGSAVAHDGRWWMVFSGFGTAVSGIGLSVSNDLMTWTKVGDGPLVPFGRDFPDVWQGRPITWFPIGDAYIYPEPRDGWYYMVTNAIVHGAPTASAGCIGALRSRDLQAWEAFKVFAYPQWFERMETPQVWRHAHRWYLVFGGAHDIALPPDRFVQELENLTSRRPKVVEHFRGNFVFTSDRFEGPYVPDKNSWLTVPGYIDKIIPGPDGRDVLLTSQRGCISPPYPVTYAADGSLQVGKP